jgi:hypothetical protein
MIDSWQTRMALGAMLATSGALVMVLSSLLGWDTNPGPWVSALSFAAGVAAGAGTVLGISSFLDRRSER